jgi:predicted NUDIX family NTP pyrophosphohydrolase
MPKRSAGLLMFRRTDRELRKDRELEVFLVHPGGPLWSKKDLGAWSIPKGLYEEDETPLNAAKREFEEETGFHPDGDYLELGDLRQPGGKIVTAWAFEGDCDPAQLVSNTFSMEWPPHSGRQIVAPEVDRGAWFTVPEARQRILIGQQPFLDRLVQKLS